MFSCRSKVIELHVTRSVQKTFSSRRRAFFTHLFDFGNVPDEGVIIHKIQELLELVQVSDVVFANPLNNHRSFVAKMPINPPKIEKMFLRA